MNTYQVVFEGLRLALADRWKNGNKSGGLQFFHEVVSNTNRFDELFGMLADDESRSVLAWLIKYRVAMFVRQSKEHAGRVIPPRISTPTYQRMIAAAKEMPEGILEGSMDVDIVENYVLDGYRLPGICEVKHGDIVLDFGAFNGNSTVALARRAGETGIVYAFEPNPGTREMMERNLQKMAITNTRIVPAAISDKPGRLGFTDAGAASRIQENGPIQVDVMTIDQWFKASSLPRVDFLKFDIEGYEVQALIGAAETIRMYRPNMAVSVYHLHNDLTTIPFLIRDINPWYRYYLRHHALHDGEIVLYCQSVSL
jgi:FkbM family methyltransferase